MSDSDIEVQASFGPPVQDRSILSTINRRTLEAFFRHPIAHNLDRIDVIALFNRLGSVEQGENSAVTYAIGDERHRVAKSRGHSLMTDEVMGLRHLLTRAGWGPGEPSIAGKPDSATASAVAPSDDWLVVLEAGEARLYHLDVHAADKAAHVIHPHDPNRILRHLSHAEQGRDEAKRSAEEGRFFEAIAKELVPGGRIVLVGHGDGHSNAAQLFAKFLHDHHHLMADRVVNTVVADIEQLSDKQMLELARTALTV